MLTRVCDVCQKKAIECFCVGDNVFTTDTAGGPSEEGCVELDLCDEHLSSFTRSIIIHIDKHNGMNKKELLYYIRKMKDKK